MAGDDGETKKDDKKVSTILSEWLLVLLIVFSLIFEFLLHRVEHWVNHRHQHLQAVMKVLYRELMVLGVVSFSFIVYELTAAPGKGIILSFEFAHVFIFLFAICYTFVVLSTMVTSLRLSRRWKRMERVDLVQYLHQKDQYTRMRLRIHKHHSTFWRSIQWWFPNWTTLFRYWQLHEMMAFHDIRFQFIFYRNLPEHFRFSSFLRKIKSLTFIHLVESHWSLYFIFLALVLLDIGRRELLGDPAKDGEQDIAESVFIIVAAVLLIALVQILAMKIRKIYWELTKNPRIYYERVEASAVEEELEKRRTEAREKRRHSRSRDGPPDEAGNIADSELTDDQNEPTDAPPEAEMLDPMHLQIPQPRGSISDVDEIVPDTSRDGKLEAGSAANKAARKGLSSDYEMDPLSNAVATRRSIDWQSSGQLGETRSAGPSLEYRRDERGRLVSELNGQEIETTTSSARASVDGLSVAIEFHETTVRHSLDLSSGQLAVTKPRPTASSSKALTAKAAVEAARKRSVEVQSERHSLDSRLPDGGQRISQGERRSRDTRRIGTPSIRSRLSSRGVSDDEGLTSGSEYGRGSVDDRGRQKRSIELAAAMPHEELATRHHGPSYQIGDRNIGVGAMNSMGQVPQSPSELNDSTRVRFNPDDVAIRTDSKNGEDQAGVKRYLSRYRSLGFMNPTIMKHLEEQQNANKTEPIQYHWLLKKLVPRLARVASPVEKLFWFGSHMFYLWCVEFTLFFSTVLLAAATASVFLIGISKERTVTGLNIASLVLPGLALLFVLLRIAGIIKKYIFILHNASLLPEAMAIETIHTVNKKPGSFGVMEDESSDLSGSETELEDGESALQRRKTLGRFFRGEAEVGNMPGIDATDVMSGTSSPAGSKRRLGLRKHAFLRRKNRMENGEEIPQIPEGGL